MEVGTGEGVCDGEAVFVGTEVSVGKGVVVGVAVLVGVIVGVSVGKTPALRRPASVKAQQRNTEEQASSSEPQPHRARLLVDPDRIRPNQAVYTLLKNFFIIFYPDTWLL